VYDELERMLGSQLFFVGDSLTLADLILAPQINFFRALPEWNALTGHLPRIREWLDRMNERPSMQTARIPAST
jgi:glutathione S-transferase